MSRPRADIDDEIIKGMLKAGFHPPHIAEACGVSAPTISNRIKELQKREQELISWGRFKHLRLAELQFELLENIGEKLPEASIGDAVQALKAINQMELGSRPEAGSVFKGLLSHLLHLENSEPVQNQTVNLQVNLNMNQEVETARTGEPEAQAVEILPAVSDSHTS